MYCVLYALNTTEKEKSWRRGRGVCVWGHWFSLGLELPERNHAKDYDETSLSPFCSRCRQVGGPRLTLLKLSCPHSNSHLRQLVKLSVLPREAFAQWVAVNPDTQWLAKMQRWWKQRTSPKMHI